MVERRVERAELRCGSETYAARSLSLARVDLDRTDLACMLDR